MDTVKIPRPDGRLFRRSDDAPRAVRIEDGRDPPVSEGFKVIKWRGIIKRTFG